MNADTLKKLYESGRWTRVKGMLEQRAKVTNHIRTLSNQLTEIERRLDKELEQFNKSHSDAGQDEAFVCRDPIGIDPVTGV